MIILKIISVHSRTKFDVGYRLFRSGLAAAYGQTNITYLGPIISNISIASDSHQINITYSNLASSSVELGNPNGFEVCCLGKQIRTVKRPLWIATPASRIEGELLTIVPTVPSSCIGKKSMVYDIYGGKLHAYSNKLQYIIH